MGRLDVVLQLSKQLEVPFYPLVRFAHVLRQVEDLDAVIFEFHAVGVTQL